MNKISTRITFVVLTSVLFAIGFVPIFVSDDVFAASPTITAYVGNDPDDADNVFESGDTLTITTDIPTNATVGSVSSASFVTGNFTFASPDPFSTLTFTTDWTAEWINSSNLVITFINISNVPVIATSTVDTTAGNTIGDQTSDESGMINGTPDILSGDFGLFVAVVTTSSSSSGCDGDCEEPTLGVGNDGQRFVDNGFSYNGKSIDVEHYFTPYPIVSVDVGEENIAEFKIYENSGIDNISHFELAFGLASGENIGMSKAVINWDRSFDGTETVTLDNPENILDNVIVTTFDGSCSDDSQTKCLIVKVVHTFRAPLDFNILGTNVWDTERNSRQNYYNHGIEVIGESLNPAKIHDGVNAGHIYHLTETSRTTAVDEFDNTWSLHNGKWMKDYVQNERVQDTSSVFNRMHSDFVEYKELWAQNAIPQLLESCPTCLDSYANFDDSFGHEYSNEINKLDNPEIIQKMILENERAQKIMNYLLDPLYYQKLSFNSNQ